MADLRSRVENLKLPMSSVKANLAQKQEDEPAAKSTEAWLVALRQNLSELERDIEGAFETRRELVKHLVEKIAIGRNGDGRAKVDITYRFGPPAGAGADGVNNSKEEFAKAHRQCSGAGLLRATCGGNRPRDRRRAQAREVPRPRLRIRPRPKLAGRPAGRPSLLPKG